ncbi:hypothetical protein PN462_01240 [Spirulina sp. CS-785/01]|nr:hypothetical protein [Spirulina sp. CS-785/01]MDB9311707.1 hypothetical protein [Spirulina sp. CS-785/01]
MTAFLLSALLLLTACTSAPPSDFQQAQQESTERGAKAVSKDAEKGGSFNKYFPKGQDNYKVVFAQEKKGFAQAKIKRGSTEVAVMSISDISSTPNAAKKFDQSTQKIQGYPVVTQGKTTHTLLVKDRFQVKVQSRDDSFTDSDRQNWLAKFDLSRIAALAE